MTTFTGLGTAAVGALTLALGTTSTSAATQLNNAGKQLTTGNVNVANNASFLGTCAFTELGIAGPLTVNSYVEITSTQDYVPPNPPTPAIAALIVEGGMGIGKQLYIGGLATFSGGIIASGEISGAGITVSSIATNTVAISGSGTTALTINGGIATIDTSGDITASGTLNVSSIANLNGGINVNNLFTVSPGGNTVINGSLTVDGTSDFIGGIVLNNNLTMTNFSITNGNISTNGTLTISGVSNLNGGLTAKNLSIGAINDTINFLNSNLKNVVIDDATNTVNANKLINGTIWDVTLTGSAPTSGQVLIATSSTTAQWQNQPAFVIGPNSSTNNGIAKFSGTTGTTLANSTITIDSNSNLYMGNSSSTSNNIYKGGNIFIADINYNISIGKNAGNPTDITGEFNIAFGANALSSITSGSDNIAMGTNAGSNITTTSDNICIGYQAGQNISGSTNIAIGSNALNPSTVQNISDNIAIGYEALNKCTSSTNIAAGTQALQNFTGSGSTNNIVLGYKAATSLLTGTNNIIIGSQAGSAYTSSESNNIVIGTSGIAGDSEVIRLGDQTNNNLGCYIAGIYGSTVSSGVTMYMNNEGQVGTSTSSIKFKENIHKMGDKTNNIMKLRPVVFNYKDDNSKKLQYGLIAEEVDEFYPELVIRDANGDINSVDYNSLIPMMINEIQRHDELLNINKQRIQKLKNL